MKRGRKPLYIHLLRAMRAGDVLYLPENSERLDRAIVSSVSRDGGKVETACFVATNLDPIYAHRVVRITCLESLK